VWTGKTEFEHYKMRKIAAKANWYGVASTANLSPEGDYERQKVVYKTNK
jgi:hypothetical protein